MIGEVEGGGAEEWRNGGVEVVDEQKRREWRSSGMKVWLVSGGGVER